MSTTKTSLMERRATLIEQLATETIPSNRVAIQSELTVVNAQLKRLNVEEAAALKYAADTKKVIGHAEQQANTERALAKLPKPAMPTPTKHAADKVLTRGEFLLKNARQMQRTIDAMKPERKLAHTSAFEQPLADFIVAQQAHLTERKAQYEARLTSGPSEWKETWSDPDGDRS